MTHNMTQCVDVSPLPVRNERIKSENPFMKQKEIEMMTHSRSMTHNYDSDEEQTPVQFSVNLQANQNRKRRSQVSSSIL